MDIPEEMFVAAEAASDVILALPGVTGWDVGIGESGGELTGDYAIRIYVAGLDQVDTSSFPGDFGGFPVSLVDGGFELDVDSNRYDPLVGGCEIENGQGFNFLGFNGTLGVIVRHTQRNVLCGLTNAHVLCVGNFGVGNAICQPARSGAGFPDPANIVGVLTDWNFDHDCAIFEIPDRLTPTRAIAGIGPVAGSRPLPEIDPNNLTRVRKRGRTTELTFGHVIARQRMVTTDPDGNAVPPHFTVRLDRAHSAPPYSAGGDSGSAVVDDANFVLGLHFGRNSGGTFGMAIPFDDVEACFPIEVAT